MNPHSRRGFAKLIVGVLLVSATGCAKLAEVREVHQELAVDRRGQVVVMPIAATASLCDIKFDEGELEGAKDYFRELVRENLNHSLSKQITVVHPKTVDQFLRRKGLPKDQHFGRRLAVKMAKEMEAEIVVFGHVKVDPVAKESLIEKTKRYDLDFEVYLFDVTNNDRLATLRCAGKRKEVLHTIPWLVKHLKYHPPTWPPAKPIPPRPKEEKKKEQKTAKKG